MERGGAVAGIPPADVALVDVAPFAGIAPADVMPVDAAPNHKKLPRKKPIVLEETHIAANSNLNRKQKTP